MLIPSLYVNLAMSFIKATVAFGGIPNSHNFQGFEKVLATISHRTFHKVREL